MNEFGGLTVKEMAPNFVTSVNEMKGLPFPQYIVFCP
jgi:hypothetical protein